MPARRGEQPLGLGLLGYEDGTWTLTTFGVAKVEPPHTFPEMLALAKKLLPERISRPRCEQAEPVGEVAFHRYPTSRWRRYHELDRFPAGIVPLGDAVASFDPTYGQGMTMTSMQAGHLRRALAGGAGEDLAREVNRATAKTTYPVWMMTAIGDHHLPPRDRDDAAGGTGPVGSLFDQFLGAAETDPVLAEWFLRRFSLLDSLYMVPSAEHCRSYYSAQHAAVARRAPSGPVANAAARWRRTDHRPTVARKIFVGSCATSRIGTVVGGHPGGGAAGERQHRRTFRAPSSNPRCTAGSAGRRGATGHRLRGRVVRHPESAWTPRTRRWECHRTAPVRPDVSAARSWDSVVGLKFRTSQQLGNVDVLGGQATP